VEKWISKKTENYFMIKIRKTDVFVKMTTTPYDVAEHLRTPEEQSISI